MTNQKRKQFSECVNTFTETRMDGVQIKRTEEIKAPSPKCCLCGVKLILNEVNVNMCLKCDQEQERRTIQNKCKPTENIDTISHCKKGVQCQEKIIINTNDSKTKENLKANHFQHAPMLELMERSDY